MRLRILGVAGDRTRMNTFTVLLNRISNRQRLPVVVNPTRTRTATLCLGKVGAPHPLARSLFAADLAMLKMDLVHILVCGTGSNVFCSCICLGESRSVVHVSTHASSTVTLTMHTSYPVLVCRSVLSQRYLHVPSRREGHSRRAINSGRSVRRRRRSSSHDTASGALRRTLRRTVGSRGCRLTTGVHSRVGREGGGRWLLCTHFLCSQCARGR